LNCSGENIQFIDFICGVAREMRIFFAGGGQCTEYLARRLIRENHDLVLLDHDEERCNQLRDSLDAQVIHGEIASLRDWQQAGLAQADMFMASTHSDETNVFGCLIANFLAPDAMVALRLRSSEYTELDGAMASLGLRVDRVIHPEIDMIERILRVISMPGVSDIRNFADGRIKLFSMNLETGSPLIGVRIGVFYQRADCSALISVVFRGNEAIIPHEDDRLAVGDHIYVISSADALKQTMEQVGIRQRAHLRQVFITGGGEVGLELARALEKEKVSVKLFELNAQRCDYLASQLSHTVVVNDDGTRQEVLLREQIEGIDAFISLTEDEDANLIACLLARRMNVDKVVPLVTSINYLELAQRLGINTTVNPLIKAADALLEFIRKGGVVSIRTLGEEKVEAIELVVPSGSGYIDKPLGSLAFPEGSLVGAIARPDGTVLIPDAEAIIGAGDHLVLFAQESVIRKLERSILSKSD
jgi:trk system potassium uptake protein TrkA